MHRAQCAICQGYLSENCKLSMPPCGHIQHNCCLLRALSNTQKCPVCREPATQVSTCKVFLNFSTEHDEVVERLKEYIIENRELSARLRLTDRELERCQIELEEAKRSEDALNNVIQMKNEINVKDHIALMEAKYKITSLLLKNKAIAKQLNDNGKELIVMSRELDSVKRESEINSYRALTAARNELTYLWMKTEKIMKQLKEDKKTLRLQLKNQRKNTPSLTMNSHWSNDFDPFLKCGHMMKQYLAYEMYESSSPSRYYYDI